jgi:hypothetical protein
MIMTRTTNVMMMTKTIMTTTRAGVTTNMRERNN